MSAGARPRHARNPPGRAAATLNESESSPCPPTLSRRCRRRRRQQRPQQQPPRRQPPPHRRWSHQPRPPGRPCLQGGKGEREGKVTPTHGVPARACSPTAASCSPPPHHSGRLLRLTGPQSQRTLLLGLFLGHADPGRRSARERQRNDKRTPRNLKLHQFTAGAPGLSNGTKRIPGPKTKQTTTNPS